MPASPEVKTGREAQYHPGGNQPEWSTSGGNPLVVSSVGRGRSEKASASSVCPPTSPVSAVWTWLGLTVRDNFVAVNLVPYRCETDLLAGHDKAVAFAAAPLPSGVAMSPTGNPAVVSERRVVRHQTGKQESRQHEQRTVSAEHGQGPFIVPARQLLVPAFSSLASFSTLFATMPAAQHRRRLMTR